MLTFTIDIPNKVKCLELGSFYRYFVSVSGNIARQVRQSILFAETHKKEDKIHYNISSLLFFTNNLFPT